MCITVHIKFLFLAVNQQVSEKITKSDSVCDVTKVCSVYTLHDS